MPLLKKILQILLPLALAVLLFWLVYKDMDFGQLAAVFKQGLHAGWLLAAILLSVFSNILRGLRWRQLLEPISADSRRKTTILAVFVSYAVNLIFPRAGEVARCGIITKHDGVSFSRTLGTVVTERLFDAVCLLVIAILAILLQLGFFTDFFTTNPESLQRFRNLASSPYLWIGLPLLVVLALLLRSSLKQTRFYERTKAFLLKMFEGMKTIATLKQPFLFVGYTLAIWLVYFLMFYVGRFFFPFEIPLGVLPMLSAFVMGSLGVLAPVQGGIGAYHFMVIYTFTFYGINEPEAAIFALVVHGVQTVQSLLLGLGAWIWLSIGRRRSA
ncbi:MAG: flippase-like domain-containing protein [Bacteroidales bacterium]|nr:flippase-like domain-containing protein [Bacteroidales bacterium]